MCITANPFAPVRQVIDLAGLPVEIIVEPEGRLTIKAQGYGTLLQLNNDVEEGTLCSSLRLNVWKLGGEPVFRAKFKRFEVPV